MTRSRPNSSRLRLLALFAGAALLLNLQAVVAYSPRGGDSFSYTETVTVNNGQGSYTGYTDQTQTTGMERVDSVSGSIVSASYSYSYQFSNNQGSSTSGGHQGTYTWSLANYTYVGGTDNQVGYSSPIYVWFAMNPALPVGGTFYALNTQFAVQSKNYSLLLPTEGSKYVQTIEAKGTGQYQRNDAYGLFTASYTWYEYFDPATGYIVGYNYLEQDSGSYQGQSGSFTYNDTLFVTSTSYALATANAPASTGANPILGNLGVTALAAAAGILLVGLGAAYFITRRRRRSRLPEHSPPPYTPPTTPPTPWGSKVDMGSNPPEQVVIRDVAKVNCKYCGTLIPTTVDKCPYCGGPRQ